MTIYMVVNLGKPLAIHVARAAAEVLVKEQVCVLAKPEVADLAKSALFTKTASEEQAYKNCDIVLSVGGDGTMLHVAKHAMLYDKPIVGINIGRLGFLSNVESNELEKLHRLVSGDYTVEKRHMLCAEITGRNEALCVALNDVVLFKKLPEKTVSMDIHCDNILVSRFRGDGVIFATPTGSTAYSLSAGGPILDARLDGIIVTQICAHIVHTPPLVVSADRVLHATSTGTQEEVIALSCDGEHSLLLNSGETVCIRRADWTVPLVQFDDAEQLEFIDSKLRGR